jgi:hypothetical protein
VNEYLEEDTAGVATTVTANLTNLTFFNNTAKNAHGGGLYLYITDSTGSTTDATAVLTSLTVNQNTAGTDSGGMYVNSALKGVVQVTNSIFDGNTVTANGYNGPVNVTMTNTNTALTDNGYNLVGLADTMFFLKQGNGNIRDDKPGLAAALAANGAPAGYPLTLALQKTSPGYESGNQNMVGFYSDVDERGFSRQAGKVSIGAEDPDAQSPQEEQAAMSLNSSVNPALVGQPVTFTATVSGGAVTPTGIVTFLDGNTVLDTVTLDSNGNAAFTTSTLALGVHDITANYGGDSNYSSSSGSLTQIISQETGSSSVSLSSSLNPAAPIQAVTFTANVSGDSGTPTGTVTFMADNDVLGTSPLDGSGNATITTSTLPLGSHTITALYNGDANYGSSSASLTQAIALTQTTTYLTSDPNPSQPGDTVTFTATVSANNGSGTPTGTVTFLNGTTVMDTSMLSVVNGQAQATFATSFGTGIYPITAIYSGDSTFAASGASGTQTVGSPDQSTVTALVLNSSSFPSQPGQAVTFTATLAWSGPTTPTGTVTFLDGTTVLGTAPVDANGNAAFTISTLAPGDHAITAIYSGDGTYAGSAASLTQSVVAGGAILTLAASANPSLSGQPVTFTATMEWDGLVTPTGTVTFYDGQTPLGTAELTVVNGQVQATFTTSALGLGSHTILAIYSGDSTYADCGASMEETITSGIQ